MRKLLKIDARDNVAVALDNLSAGFAIDQEDLSVTILTDVSQAQKVALSDIAKGENIIKYGQPIGHATSPIPKGEKVDETNIKTNLEGVLEYNYSPEFTPNQYRNRDLTFKGFRRKNGDVGIRNELWIVPTVGCVNGIGEQMLNALKREVDISRIDGIEIFKHNYGCSQLGDDHENTKKILRDIVLHPNAGGVLVLGLGCENNQPDVFREFLGDFDEERIKFLVTQDVKNEHEEGLKILKELYEKMAEDVREEIPLSELKVGLKCGGSDGFSGISANPLLGAFSDFLVAQGGTTVLTEVPEMFGAETLLMNRAENRDVFEKTVHLINDFKNYFIENKQPIYENPSPGNKAGGISTLEEKSLGCTQKCGTDKVRDVLKYGERLTTKGLNLLSSPGNDLVAATALGAAGCHLVLFTTGRGTPFGSFVPTMKISTNTPLYEKKPHWIDFNAGPIADGKQIEDVLEEFIPYLIDVASGNQVNNEKYGFREIAIFKTGVTL
ncbi:UxaA family hydrolase [Marinilabilia salmonicolor]|uniref:D-altronate dehydratase n=1 Tax=Marinilabilia salmonicolor TaxID=989 RepID=A0A368UNN9_9BACT|nr:altronate dehydratase family protein [Marinilabilia salmonicolor]RCW30402.1 D-altronate dehydratase [Marinilabilia salmonicolor]